MKTETELRVSYVEGLGFRTTCEAALMVHRTIRYRGTSLIRDFPPLGPYSRTMLRVGSTDILTDFCSETSLHKPPCAQAHRRLHHSPLGVRVIEMKKVMGFELHPQGIGSCLTISSKVNVLHKIHFRA